MTANLRKEHRMEQGEAADRDFDKLWADYLLNKALSYGLSQRHCRSVREIARVAFFSGAFAEFREHISDDA